MSVIGAPVLMLPYTFQPVPSPALKCLTVITWGFVWERSVRHMSSYPTGSLISGEHLSPIIWAQGPRTGQFLTRGEATGTKSA